MGKKRINQTHMTRSPLTAMTSPPVSSRSSDAAWPKGLTRAMTSRPCRASTSSPTRRSVENEKCRTSLRVVIATTDRAAVPQKTYKKDSAKRSSSVICRSPSRTLTMSPRGRSREVRIERLRCTNKSIAAGRRFMTFMISVVCCSCQLDRDDEAALLALDRRRGLGRFSGAREIDTSSGTPRATMLNGDGSSFASCSGGTKFGSNRS